MKERKELFCGTWHECVAFINERDKEATNALASKRFQLCTNFGPGPTHSVFYKRVKRQATIERPVRRLTRQEFKVQGVSKRHKRPLWVSFEPGDVITFCPQGTSQRVTVPIASLYHFARFTAARAVALAKKKGGK